MERGQDPARLPLFVSGGNGPLHGPGVARALGSPAVVAPPAAGVLSALGFLSAPMSIDVVRSRHVPLDEIDPAEARALFDEMAREGAGVLVASGLATDQVDHERTLEMRFVGQGSEIEVPVPAVGEDWPARVHERFRREYTRRFGDVAPSGVAPEVLTWRVTSSGPRPTARLRFEVSSPAGSVAGSVAGNAEGARLGHRSAYFPSAGGYIRTAVYDRYRLVSGDSLEGPALVQERESTLLLPPGARATVLVDGGVLVELGDDPGAVTVGPAPDAEPGDPDAGGPGDPDAGGPGDSDAGGPGDSDAGQPGGSDPGGGHGVG
jgi:N-methylhydantoinase A